MGDTSAHQLTPQKLDSWKEIAAFFDRDERTVRRWEKERALPVHRVPGGGRGGVYAYPSELKDWLKGRASDLDRAVSESAPAPIETPSSDATPSTVRSNENWTVPGTASSSPTANSPEPARVLEIR